jgi:hypothetical protein
MIPDMTLLRIALFGFVVSVSIVLISLDHALTVPGNPHLGIRGNPALEKWVPRRLVHGSRKKQAAKHGAVAAGTGRDAPDPSAWAVTVQSERR